MDHGLVDEGELDEGELDRRRGRPVGEGDVDLRRLQHRRRCGRRGRSDQRHLDEIVLEQVVLEQVLVVEPPRMVSPERASWGGM
jgi:hypothetical protein